jgi:hypothetical protein
MGYYGTYTAIVYHYIVGNTADVNLAYAAVDDIKLVGIEAVHADVRGSAVAYLDEVGGVDLDLNILGVDIDIALAETDSEFATLALELVEVDVVVGGGEFYHTVLGVALYQLYVAHAGHVDFFEGGEFILFGDDVVARINQVAT